MSSRRRDGFDIRQMQIDWNGEQSSPPVDGTLVTVDRSVRDKKQAASPDPSNPVVRLRWDFRTRFPQPLPDAVDAGRIAAEDTAPKSIEAIHQEHGRRMLGALEDLDAVMEQRRNLPASPARPKSDTLNEPRRLERWYQSLLGLYEEWFGQEAAKAFDRAVQAWHAHIEVVVDKDAVSSSNSMEIAPVTRSSITQPQDVPPIIEAEVCDPLVVQATRRLPATTEKRIIARLPVHKPLPAAVAAGHFGIDEQGQPIDPSADEVYAITCNHAESLIELIQSLPASGRAAEPITAELQDGIAKYAEDFGDHAAARLLAYCRRQARVNDVTGGSSARSR